MLLAVVQGVRKIQQQASLRQNTHRSDRSAQEAASVGVRDPASGPALRLFSFC
jgi:hypothetical protein